MSGKDSSSEGAGYGARSSRPRVLPYPQTHALRAVHYAAGSFPVNFNVRLDCEGGAHADPPAIQRRPEA